MASVPPVIGEQFGRWTITATAPSRGRQSRVDARCVCGYVQEVSLAALCSGRTTQCAPCGRLERAFLLNIEMLHKVFGEWTVMGRSRIKGSGGKTVWEVRCSCGADSRASTDDLRRGRSTKCRSCSSLEKAARRRNGE